MSAFDKSTSPDTKRPEFSGPEQLDKVLVHLREVRDRAAAEGRTFNGSRNANGSGGTDGAGTGGRRTLARAGERSVRPFARPKPKVNPADVEKVEFPTPDASLAAGPARAPGPNPPAPDAAAATADPTAQGSGAAPAPTRAPLGEGPASDAPASAPAGVTGRLAGAIGRAGERLAKTGEAPPLPGLAAAKPTPKATITSQSELVRAIMVNWPAFKSVAWFSFTSNILMLAGPLFMLQVYDRVMTSGSIPTLLVLSALTAAIYGVIGLLELVRSRVIVRVGVEFDQRVGDRVFGAALKRSLAAPGSSMMALRELDQVRQFVSGPGPLTFFDAPWTPVYLLVIFLTHWMLGVAATLGAILLLILAWASEARSRMPMAEAGRSMMRSLELAESGQRNAESITAMGMLRAYRGRWQIANREALAWQVLAADRLASMTSVSKSLRLLMQSMMLAIGAALAIGGEISAGSIIAATIIFGRALAPVEQAVGQWRSFIKARESFAKIEGLLKAHPEEAAKTALPAPAGRLEAKGLRVDAPESRAPILANVSFAVAPGQMVAVIGPSASGKSTLARALVGLWPPAGGEIRLDGARLEQWNSEELGRNLGYLPQNVELFAGTVRENIARFETDATDEDVVAAARAAHAHDMIMALPKGYESQLGAFGTYLSAGQRQRIGLARALFRNPALVVLDEPNANLDRSGDEALASAIDGMRSRGCAVILISHRVQAIGKADLLLYLERGQQRAFGPRDDVLRFLQGGGQPQGASPNAGGPRPGNGPVNGAGNGNTTRVGA